MKLTFYRKNQEMSNKIASFFAVKKPTDYTDWHKLKNQCNPGNLWASFFHRLRATPDRHND
jgi:hypothetical protein